MEKIKTKDLTLKDVPLVGAPVIRINEFALTYDWEENGDKVLLYSLDSNFEYLDISILRLILYCEQRRWNHFGIAYDRDTEVKIRILLKEIREKLAL